MFYYLNEILNLGEKRDAGGKAPCDISVSYTHLTLPTTLPVQISVVAVSLKKFFKKTISEERHKQAASVSVPEGLWIKCPKCGEMVYKEDVISNAYVCPKCGGYFRISAKRRIKMIADEESFKEWFTGIENNNPLDYPDYPQKIENLKEKKSKTIWRMKEYLSLIHI